MSVPSKLNKLRLLAYDFDGVICDSIHECFVVSFTAYYENVKPLKEKLEIKENRTTSIKNVSNEFIDVLHKNGLSSEIVGREKTPFSVWRKIQKKRTRPFKAVAPTLQ